MAELTRYGCEEAFQRLDDYLDRELNADEMRLVAEHLEVCAVCAAEFEFDARVLDVVRSKLRSIDVPSGLRQSIASALDAAKG